MFTENVNYGITGTELENNKIVFLLLNSIPYNEQFCKQ